jgi:hypothetical protein
LAASFNRHRAGPPSLSPLDDLATFGSTATMVPGDHYGRAAIFATILREYFQELNSWTARNTASINQQNVVV